MNSSYPNSVTGSVRTLLQLEGLSVLIAATTLYSQHHESWWFYAALFFLPDISFLAYLRNPREGALAYNALHSYVGPLALSLFNLPIALIWIAHIGFDRAVGYGLKYASAFGDTHLGHKGK